jgi:predicted DNA-binding transcriptional regulator AlpA
MNLPELMQQWREGRATVTFDEAIPSSGVSRATFYRSAAAGEIPGVLRLGRKRLLSLPVYLEWLGVPHEKVWDEA